MFLFPSHSPCVWCGRSRSNLSKGSHWETVMWVGEPTNCGGRPQKFCDPDQLLNFSQLIEDFQHWWGTKTQVYLPPDGKQHKQVCTINIYSLNEKRSANLTLWAGASGRTVTVLNASQPKQQLCPGMPQGGATGSRAQAETLCSWVSQTIAVFSRQKERWQST